MHTLELQNKNSTTDNIIVEIAIQQNRIVISKDHDFWDSFLLNSKPEKLILVRTGNIPNKIILKLFDDNLETIKLMISRNNLIEISKSEIAEHEGL
ncbi:MAG: DUF5615 family PIN-like protein [Bacteroidetes bacterium]|nr:DUF5615 family PIN-like protein [Bacteroidota bacterium]